MENDNSPPLPLPFDLDAVVTVFLVLLASLSVGGLGARLGKTPRMRSNSSVII